jgi:hypothetical protein
MVQDWNRLVQGLEVPTTQWPVKALVYTEMAGWCFANIEMASDGVRKRLRNLSLTLPGILWRQEKSKRHCVAYLIGNRAGRSGGMAAEGSRWLRGMPTFGPILDPTRSMAYVLGGESP